MTVHTVHGGEYYVSKLLLYHWNKNSLEKMKKSNSDRVYIVDGMERSGKSWWTFQQAGVLDEKMFSSTEEMCKRVCFSPEEFMTAIRTVKNGVIIFDEAFRGFSSRSALSKTNKKLISGLMEMGQNNNIVFIVLPRIFLLDMYASMLRSHGLFNIYLEKRSGKRAWRGYSMQDKNSIYQMGAKKGWKYQVATRFKDRFYNKFPGGDEFMNAYLEKKRKAFMELEKVEDEGGYTVPMIERDLFVNDVNEKYINSHNKTAVFYSESTKKEISKSTVTKMILRAKTHLKTLEIPENRVLATADS